MNSSNQRDDLSVVDSTTDSSNNKTIAILTDVYVDYQRSIVDAFSDALTAAGYRTLCFSGRELNAPEYLNQDFASCNEIYKLAGRADIDGIICLSGALGRHVEKSVIQEFIQGFDVPVVSFGIDVDGVPSVTNNDLSGMGDLMKHVLSNPSRQRLAFLRGFPTDIYSKQRESVFRGCLKAAGLTVDESLFITGNYDAFDSYSATYQLLERDPKVDGIIAANDVMALGAARAAAVLGFSVPDNIAITGFDNTKEATQNSPALTTVRQPIAEMVEQAVRVLLEQLETPHSTYSLRDAHKTTCLNSELIIRGSTSLTEIDSLDESLADAQKVHHMLLDAMTGLNTPADIDLTLISHSLGDTLAHQTERLAETLGQIDVSPGDEDRLHWLHDLSRYIEDLTFDSLVEMGRVEDAMHIRGSLSTLREKIWTASLAHQFEMRRMEQARASLQLQIGSCTRLEDMSKVLDRWLAHVRPERFYLVHYDTPTPKVPEYARLIKVSHKGEAIDFNGSHFLTRDLLPSCPTHTTVADRLVLYPIHAGSEHFGFLLIDPIGVDLSNMNDAADSIGNAMRNQHLIMTLKQQTAALQDNNVELTKLANFDALTKLPNRRSFERSLVDAFASDSSFTLSFIDLDGFKLVNDTLGHENGDLLLQQVAERLKKSIQSHAEHRILVARLGGDEFTLLTQGLDKDSMANLAKSVLESLALPYELAGQKVNISGSLGYARYPEDATTTSTLLRAADAAMYAAKKRGKNRAHIFHSDLLQSDDQRLLLAQDMRDALDNNALTLYYQPRIDLANRRLSGVEALMRWIIETPEGNYHRAGPQEFIPVAEKSGLIARLDTFALVEACRQARAWADAGTPIPVSVNVSVLQLQQEDFIGLVERTLVRHRLDPSLLEIEITESASMADVENSIVKLGRLRELGVRISIDDFGTGHSSLSYLKRLPVDTIKIDRSFIADVTEDDSESSPDAAIIRSVAAFAKTMKFRLVAEGIETEAQQQFATALGCDEGQGYRFGHPQPAEDITALLERGLDWDEAA